MTQLFFLENLEMLEKLLKLCNDFGQLSGAKLNLEKCKGMPMKFENVKNVSIIKMEKGPEKLLGVHVGKNVNSELYWQGKIQRLHETLSVWKMRDLSLQGRVYLLKSIGLSSILYEMEMKEMNCNVINKINKIMFGFLWNNKRPLVKREVTYLPRIQGGLDMFDLETIIKVKRIKFVIRVLRKNLDESWKLIPLKYFRKLDSKFGVNYFLLKTTDGTKMIHQLDIPQFYRECLLYFQEFLRKTNIFSDMNEIIWCNKRLEDAIALPYWSKRGLVSVSDIIKQDGGLKEEEISQILTRYPGLFFDMVRLKHCLPSEWKEENAYQEKICVSDLRPEDILNLEIKINDKGKIKKVCDLTSKELYSILMSKKVIKVKSFQYWEEKYPEISFHWNDYFMFNLKNKLMSRIIIDFNFKIFHGVINTEKRLLLMKLSNGKCVHCTEIENLEHLFVRCDGLDLFWRNVESFIKIIVPNLVLNDIIKTLGIVNKEFQRDKCQIVSFLIALGRYVIWKRRNFVKYEGKNLDIQQTIIWYKQYLIHCLNVLFNFEKGLKYKEFLIDLI